MLLEEKRIVKRIPFCRHIITCRPLFCNSPLLRRLCPSYLWRKISQVSFRSFLLRVHGGENRPNEAYYRHNRLYFTLILITKTARNFANTRQWKRGAEKVSHIFGERRSSCQWLVVEKERERERERERDGICMAKSFKIKSVMNETEFVSF